MKCCNKKMFSTEVNVNGTETIHNICDKCGKWLRVSTKYLSEEESEELIKDLKG